MEVLPETPEHRKITPMWRDEPCPVCGCDACDHDDAPVPASQSVPAVPVSSTGGKETGEAAETATEALRLPAEVQHRIDEIAVGVKAMAKVAHTLAVVVAKSNRPDMAGWLAEVAIAINAGRDWPVLAPLSDSETEPDNWESGAYIEPGIGGVANVSTSGWPGGVNRVWLRVDSYFDKNRGADIVLEPDEADEIAAVLRGAAQSVRRDPGVTS